MSHEKRKFRKQSGTLPKKLWVRRWGCTVTLHPGVDILTDNEQVEPFIPFYDRELLRRYLARNRACASTGCKVVGARQWRESDHNFYCDDCARTIQETQPGLPGLSPREFVKI